MKKMLFMATAAIMAMVSCKKADSDMLDSARFSNDAAAHNKRLSFKNIGVLGYQSANKTGGRGMQPVPVANQYPIELIAELFPPTVNGQEVQASHVDANGSVAYVAYNQRLDGYVGGIEIVDVSNALSPSVVSQVLFPDRDISSVTYHNNRLYFVGACHMPNYPGFTTPAIFGYLDLTNNGTQFAGTGRTFNMPGRVATDLTIDGNRAYITSGNDGVFVTFDLTSETVVSSNGFADLRSVAVNNSTVALYSGDSKLRYFNKSNLSAIRTVDLPADWAEAKRTIAFHNDYLIVSAGKRGVQLFDPTGTKTDEILLPTSLPNINPDEIVTNGVTNNNGYFAAANGAAGIYVADMTPVNNFNVIGRIDLNGSANFVKSVGNYIYVANGRGGIKIIRLVRGTIHGINCNTFPDYAGSSDLVVGASENLVHGQALGLQSLTVNGRLYHCGTVTVLDAVNVNNGGTLEVHGAFSQGQYPAGTGAPFTVKSGGHLMVEGHLKVYGDFVMESNSRLTFLGTNSRITIYGRYIRGNNITIIGTSYVDTYNKLDVTPDYNNVFTFLNSTTNNSSGVSATAVALDAFQRFEFNSLSNPSGAMQTMNIYEGSNLKLTVTFPADYIGRPYRYGKTYNQTVTRNFAAGDIFL